MLYGWTNPNSDCGNCSSPEHLEWAPLNALNYKTNYGTEYAGGRGSYRLIQGTYHRLEAAGKAEIARVVAESFVQPDGRYAYS